MRTRRSPGQSRGCRSAPSVTEWWPEWREQEKPRRKHGNASDGRALARGCGSGVPTTPAPTWEWTGPHFPMEEVYSCLVDTRGDRRGCSPAHRRAGSARRCGAPTTWARPGRRRPTARSASPRTPASRWPGSGSWSARGRGRRGLGRHRARRRLPVHRPRRDVRPRAGAVGPPAPHRVERRASVDRPSTRSCPHPTDPASVTAAISTGGVYRTTDDGASWFPSNQGIKAEFMPGDLHYPEFGQCVHKVVAAPGQAGPAVPAEPRRRLPLRGRRGLLAVHRRRAPVRLRLPDRRPTRTSPTRSSSSRSVGRRLPLAGRREGPGLALPRRRRHLGAAR